MELTSKNGCAVGVFPVLRILAPELELYFATRRGGKSPPPYHSLDLGGEGEKDIERVRDNRNRLFQLLRIPEGLLARCGQVHGSDIAVADKGGLYKDIDGLITAREGLALAISTADCYPVIIYSPPEKALAALHVGRKGAAKGIIPKAIGILRADFSINLKHTIALIGPGICSKCYRINSSIARNFPRDVISERSGHYHLDLLKSIKRELAGEGLRKRNIYDSEVCTSCREDICFSYRRDNGVTGRHWTLARINIP